MEKPKVLYVDDDSINLQLFEAYMEDKFQVLLAGDALTGLEMLQSQSNIRIVVSDMKMPYMDGIEFISKARTKHPSVKYFLLTAYDVSCDIREALDQGVIVQCFHKPITMNSIEHELKKVI